MRKVSLFIFLSFLFCSFCLGQKITLNDLIVLNKKKNWEEVNTVLLNKGWTYFSSSKGDEENYNTIVWSFEKERYSDKAKGWFWLFTYEDVPSKISYTVHNKPSYTLIQNSLSSNGFKLVSNEIEDDEIIAKYQSNDFEISCRTIKLENDYSASTTGYEFILITRSGIYDPDNGFKKGYYESGELKQEINLKNGELNGLFKQYHENGKLHISGNFLSGKENGIFKEYYEDGSIKLECVYLNGKMEGEYKRYINNLLEVKQNYKLGKLEGPFTYFFYTDEGVLNSKTTGYYSNDSLNGKLNTIKIDNGIEEIMEDINYSNGSKEGLCKIYLSEDTLQTAEYKNGKLDGLCTLQVLVELNRIGNSEKFTTWPIVSIQNYSNGILQGHSSFYAFNNKISEGIYLNGDLHGTWIDYVSSGTYKGEIESKINYKNGKRDGLSEIFFYSDFKPNTQTINGLTYTSQIQVFNKVSFVSNYKNGFKDGEYSMFDSLGTLIEKGQYDQDKKTGNWIKLIANYKDSTDRIYETGEYLEGEKYGKWQVYDKNNNVLKEKNYSKDKLDGEAILRRRDGTIQENLSFIDGQLQNVIYYDSLGLNPQVKFEIYDIKKTNFRCRLTEFYDDYYEMQEYWLLMDKDEEYDPFDFATYFAYNLETKTGVISSHKDGAFGFYGPDNKPMVLGSYYKEEPTGKWIYYHYSQNLKIEENQTGPEEYFDLNGKRYTGEFSYIDEESGTKEIRKIKNGLRNGKTKYLSIDKDKVIKTEKYEDGVLED
jgi:antitoxin component YwqK of YwqJK toxin-antitoxin module